MKKFFWVTLLVGACSANAASVVEPEPESPTTPVDVATELQTACDAGDAAACTQLGIRYERGDVGTAHDHDKATALYARACELGNATGCYTQALILMYDQKDVARAARLLSQTCDAKHGPSCAMLGDLYRDGKVLGFSEKRALGYYQTACDSGYQNGCAEYIELVWTAAEQLTSLEDFSAYLSKNCEAEHAGSCEELGKLYESGVQWNGFALEADPEKSAAAFAKAAYLRRVSGPRGWWDEIKTQPPSDASADVENTQPLRDATKPAYLNVSGVVGTIVLDGVDTNIKSPGRVMIFQLGRHVVSVRQANGVQTRPKVVYVSADKGMDLVFQ